MLDTLTATRRGGGRSAVGPPRRAARRGVRRAGPAVPERGPRRRAGGDLRRRQGTGPATLAVAAGVGAFVGDTLTYVVGRRFGTAAAARGCLAARASAGFRPGVRHARAPGAVVVLSARYVPMGRVAVNLTAGATGFPPRRFAGLAGLAAASWAAWSVGVGAAGRSLARGQPAARLGSRASASRSCSACRRPRGPSAQRLGPDAGGAARRHARPALRPVARRRWPGRAARLTPRRGPPAGARRLHSPPESANNGVSTLPVRVTILTGPVRVGAPAT